MQWSGQKGQGLRIPGAPTRSPRQRPPHYTRRVAGLLRLRERPGTPSEGTRVVARATFPARPSHARPQDPALDTHPAPWPCAPRSRAAWSPEFGCRSWGRDRRWLAEGGWGETGPQRRAKAVASTCPAPWAASRCHPLQHQSAPRRRLAPASPRLPLRDLGRSGPRRRGGRNWRPWRGRVPSGAAAA